MTIALWFCGKGGTTGHLQFRLKELNQSLKAGRQAIHQTQQSGDAGRLRRRRMMGKGTPAAAFSGGIVPAGADPEANRER